MKKLSEYFSVLKGVKLPWLLIILCFIFSASTMSAELQSATLTASVIDTSQKAINGKALFSYMGVTAAAAVLSIVSY